MFNTPFFLGGGGGCNQLHVLEDIRLRMKKKVSINLCCTFQNWEVCWAQTGWYQGTRWQQLEMTSDVANKRILSKDGSNPQSHNTWAATQLRKLVNVLDVHWWWWLMIKCGKHVLPWRTCELLHTSPANLHIISNGRTKSAMQQSFGEDGTLSNSDLLLAYTFYSLF